MVAGLVVSAVAAVLTAAALRVLENPGDHTGCVGRHTCSVEIRETYRKRCGDASSSFVCRHGRGEALGEGDQSAPGEATRWREPAHGRRRAMLAGGHPGSAGHLVCRRAVPTSVRLRRGLPDGAPEVTFVGTVPVHHHIYSNGHICLSLLVSPPRPCL